MARRCAPTAPDNSAFELGVLLGELALHGRDKPTLIAPPELAAFGAWLEQLVAESLGKDRERHSSRSTARRWELRACTGRIACSSSFARRASRTLQPMPPLTRLERAGHPIVRIEWPDRDALGAEFFRWEFATAVAGAVLGVNPFDQPDVEATKVVTRRMATDYERTGTLPAGDVADPRSVGALFDQLREGDYFAVLAFIEMNRTHIDALETIRDLVRDRRKVATTVGFGPRYLHSTGPGHKGGPNSGVFLLITCDDPEDVPVPRQKYSFGTIKLAQALGDLEVLAARGRRVMRVHFKDVESGLRELVAAVEASAYPT